MSDLLACATSYHAPFRKHVMCISSALRWIAMIADENVGSARSEFMGAVCREAGLASEQEAMDHLQATVPRDQVRIQSVVPLLRSPLWSYTSATSGTVLNACSKRSACSVRCPKGVRAAVLSAVCVSERV